MAARIIGGIHNRNNIVDANFDILTGDRILWLEKSIGRTLATSRIFSSQPAPGNIVTPGFGERFYYLSCKML